MSPWPPSGQQAPHGKGTKPVTLPRPGHADLAGVLKYGHDDVRNALERASARHTAVHVAAGAVAKALLGELGIDGRWASGRGRRRDRRRRHARGDRRRARRPRHTRRDRRGGRDGRAAGLGSYAEKSDRLDARLALALMGIQAVKGVEIGDGLALARRPRLGGARRDRPRPRPSHEPCGRHRGRRSRTASRSSSAPAMKPLPTLMRPLDSVDLETGEPAQALVERSDVQAVEALAVVAEAAVALELARAAREKLGGDALVDVLAAHRSYLDRIARTWHPAAERARTGTSASSVSWARGSRPLGRSSQSGWGGASSISTRSSRSVRRGSDRRDLRVPRRGGVPRARGDRRKRRAPRRRTGRARARRWCRHLGATRGELLRARSACCSTSIRTRRGGASRAATGRSPPTSVRSAPCTGAAASVRRRRGRAAPATSTASSSRRPASTSQLGAIDDARRARSG